MLKSIVEKCKANGVKPYHVETTHYMGKPELINDKFLSEEEIKIFCQYPNFLVKEAIFEVYYNSTLLNSYTSVNQYLTSDRSNYSFNVYKYAVDRGIAYTDVNNLRFSYIYEEE